MSVPAGEATPFVVPARRAFRQPANLAVTLAAILIFMLVDWLLLRHGYLSRALVGLLHDSAAWRSGGWMTQVLLVLVRAIPRHDLQQTVLSLVSAGAVGGLFGILYHSIRDSDWSAPAAMLVLILLGGHALMVYAVTSASLPIPLFIAFAALIPAIRRLESVGDVQAEVSFGLVLPLLLLAGPQTAPLIPPLAVAGAIANVDGRSDPRAFVAMVLVAIMPSLIIVVGVVGFAMQSGVDPVNLMLPYIAAFSALRLDGLGPGLLAITALAPIGLVPIVYCFVPDRRRKIWSAIAVVGLPFYLAAGNAIFPWRLPGWAPALALLFTFSAWIAVARLRLPLRIACLVLLAASTVASWTLTGIWDDPEWKAALGHMFSLS